MSELLNGIFECLDISSSTGLASEDSLRSMSPFQRLFYTQAHEKIGIDAVYFLRDINGVAKIPLIYFSVIQKYKQRCTRGYKRYKETSGLIEWKECQIFHSIFT